MTHELEEAGFTKKQAAIVAKKIRRSRRQDLIFIAASLLILLSFALWRQHGFTEQVNAAAIKNCHDTNATTAGLQQSLERGIEITKSDIEETRTTDYSVIFPNLTPQELKPLLRAQVAKLKEQNTDRRADLGKLVIVDCEARFP